jgi:hypothetical protein
MSKASLISRRSRSWPEDVARGGDPTKAFFFMGAGHYHAL